MKVDPKQAVAGALTLGMVIMFINMLAEGFRSPGAEIVSVAQANTSNVLKLETKVEETELMITTMHKENQNLWGDSDPVLEPCWGDRIKGKKAKRSQGYVTIELLDGPQYHRLQVADAVAVAWALGATFLLPTINDEEAKEPNSNLNDLYDVPYFIESLGVVKVAKNLPEEETPTVVKVPYRVTADYIKEKIRPIFMKKKVIKLVGFFPKASLKIEEEPDEGLEAIRCLVMYKALRFHSRVEKEGERILNKIRGSGGHFVAVDLRLDLLEQKGCSQSANPKRKKCFNVQEVGSFLKELGFPSNTPIYLTQSKEDDRLNPLKEKFQNVYTKEGMQSLDEDEEALVSGKMSGLDKAIDFYVCSESDVFVPAISGIFYSTVAGERIASGKTQILVPTTKDDDSKPMDLALSSVISGYVKNKDHPVYSCFCKDSK